MLAASKQKSGKTIAATTYEKGKKKEKNLLVWTDQPEQTGERTNLSERTDQPERTQNAGQLKNERTNGRLIE